LRLQPEAIDAVASKSVAPNPNVTVSDAAFKPSLSPVSSGGASGSVLSSPTGRPAVMRRRSSPFAEHVDDVVLVARGHVERGHEQLVCAGVMMPAWCARGTARGPRARTPQRGSCQDVRTEGGGSPNQRAGTRGACHAEEPPTADCTRPAHVLTICFATFESGSASASISCDSAFVSAEVRLV
jgi:hypothetical protein